MAGFFKRIIKAVSEVFRTAPRKQKPTKTNVPRDTGRVAPRKQALPPQRNLEVDKTVKPTNPAYDQVWRQLQDNLDDILSDTGVKRFNAVEPELAAYYDVWSDPNEDDGLQRDAYDAFMDILADYGMTHADLFNWADFAEVYQNTQD